MINLKFIYGILSSLVYLITKSNNGISSIYYLTHATFRKSIVLTTDLDKIYLKNKNKTILSTIFLLFFLLTLEKLGFISTPSFWYSNILSFFIYLFLLERNIISKKDFKNATIILNQIVMVLYWIFFILTDEFKQDLKLKDKSLSRYLHIINSLNSHLFMNLYISKDITRDPIGINGLLLATFFYLIYSFSNLFTYINTLYYCKKKSEKIKKELNKKIPDNNKIFIDLKELQNTFSKSIFYENSSNGYNSVTAILNKNKKIDYNFFKILNPDYNPSDKELNLFKDDKFLENILLKTGFIGYGFLRIKKGQKIRDILKNPIIYGSTLSIPIIYGINKGIYKLFNRK